MTLSKKSPGYRFFGLEFDVCTIASYHRPTPRKKKIALVGGVVGHVIFMKAKEIDRNANVFGRRS